MKDAVLSTFPDGAVEAARRPRLSGTWRVLVHQNGENMSLTPV
jgi:hypothetical protein